MRDGICRPRSNLGYTYPVVKALASGFGGWEASGVRTGCSVSASLGVGGVAPSSYTKPSRLTGFVTESRLFGVIDAVK